MLERGFEVMFTGDLQAVVVVDMGTLASCSTVEDEGEVVGTSRAT